MSQAAIDQRGADIRLLIAVAGRSAGDAAVTRLHRIKNSLTAGALISVEQYEAALGNLIGFQLVDVDASGDDGRGVVELTEHGDAWLKSNFRLVEDERFVWEPVDEDWQMTSPPSSNVGRKTMIENEGSN